MPKYIKPTLTLTANKSSASSLPGPLSVALSLNGTGSFSVDSVQSEIVTVSNGTPQQLLQQDITMGGPGVGGTAGGFLYMKNISTTSTTDFIYVGCDPTADDLEGSPGADAKRLFTLKTGEFAFFPYDYNYDINIDSNAANQTLEYWLFDRG